MALPAMVEMFHCGGGGGDSDIMERRDHDLSADYISTEHNDAGEACSVSMDTLKRQDIDCKVRP
jgi:hypothetical protein